ncbi:unnamed protein product, partial [Prunus brigantina]
MQNAAINMAEFTHESTEEQKESLQKEDPRPTFISALLKEPLKSEIIALLQDFRDYFAWHYHEMPGLDRILVEHKLPIKEGYLPIKQARRRISMEAELKVKIEIERLVKAGFIKPAIYDDWLANIVPVLKRKTGAVRICADYRNLNEAEATGMTPYALTYGNNAILPMEIAVQSLKIALQHNLIGKDYSQAMLLELEGLDASRIDTLNKLLAGKQAVSRAYNKRVKNKSFEEGEIVWKAVLPLGTHIAGYEKWSPTWEGPFIIKQILGLGTYRLQDRDGDIHATPINGKWLTKFYPTMWD